jgi:hypothetical protein
MFRFQVTALSLLGIVACAGLAAPLNAQAPARSGFFIGFGLGAGSLGIEDASERQSAPSGYFKIGGAISDQVLLGAESTAWVKEEGAVTLTSTSVSAVAYVYLDPTGGFFLKGGLGLATVEVDSGLFGGASETGSAVTLGAGYDFGFGGKFGLTPYGGVVVSSFEGGNTNLLHFGLGVNWY